MIHRCPKIRLGWNSESNILSWSSSTVKYIEKIDSYKSCIEYITKCVILYFALVYSLNFPHCYENLSWRHKVLILVLLTSKSYDWNENNWVNIFKSSNEIIFSPTGIMKCLFKDASCFTLYKEFLLLSSPKSDLCRGKCLGLNVK